MTATLKEHLHFSEDYPSHIIGAESDFSLDLLQYGVKNFNFWRTEDLDRGVNRYITTFRSGILSASDMSDDSPEQQIDEEFNSKLDDDEKVLNFPAVFVSRVLGERSVNTLQEWDCVITSIQDNIIEARGLSLLDDDPQYEVLHIPVEEFCPDDRPILIPGVVFRFVIFFARKANHQLSRESTCYVRKSFSVNQNVDTSALSVFLD
jgi:hypothetical protein